MNLPARASALSWVPDTCTLPTLERPLREAEFAGFFASAVEGVTYSSALSAVIRLRPEPAVAAQAAALAVRETSCCSFFTFTLTANGGRLSLEVAVPAAQRPVLTALVEQATRHVDRPGR
jgi:hypothetical protein